MYEECQHSNSYLTEELEVFWRWNNTWRSYSWMPWKLALSERQTTAFQVGALNHKVSLCLIFRMPHNESYSLYFPFFYMFYTKYNSKTENSFIPKCPVLYSAHKEKQTLKTAIVQTVNEQWLSKWAQRTSMIEISPFSATWKSQCRSTPAVGVNLSINFWPSPRNRSYSSQDSETLMNVDAWYQTSYWRVQCTS